MKKNDKNRSNDDFEDDGRTIVDMNIEGASWYDKSKKNKKEIKEKINLGKGGTSSAVFGALAAGVLIWAVIFGALALVLLLITYRFL